ncbi:MAG: ATP-binding protein [Bacteroidota bacterium]
MRYLRILIWSLLSIMRSQLVGQPVYTVDPQFSVHDLQPYLEYIHDVDQVITPEQVLSDSALVFTIQDERTRYLRIGEIYWGRITLQTSKALEGWTLNFEDRLEGLPAWTKSNGQVDVYGFSRGNQIFHKKTGVEYPSKERDVQDTWFLNKVSIADVPIDQPIDLVIKIKGNALGYPPYFHATLRSPKQPYYQKAFAFGESFNVFMLGVTFIIFLYHFLQFLYLRERLFLWFSLWVLFCCLTMAMSVGLIIGAVHQYRYPMWNIIANGVMYSFWFFGRSFINSKAKFPKLDRFILMLSIAMIVEILLTALYVSVFNPQTYLTGVGIHYKMIILYSSLSIVVSIILMLKKDWFARYFGFGAIIVSLAFVVGGLWSERIIRLPIDSVPVDPYAWGMFLQIVIYSFGIAYRQRTLLLKSQEEKLEAQKNYAEMERIKDLDEIKTQFYTNLSHEFRTPLSLIAGPLELARKSQDRPGAPIQISPKTFNIIERNTQRLQHLIDQLLELSQLESGKVHLKLSQGNLIQFLKSIAFSFESMSESKGLSFNTSFPEELPMAYYDKDKLEKIIGNLLSNAFKYTSDGGAVTLSVDFSESHYVIEISDTGKGMTKEEVKRIFERFYRVEGTEAKGSGIGLAIAKEMVDLHNGQISVNSRMGEGTNFKVRIPYTLECLPEHRLLVSPKNTSAPSISEKDPDLPSGFVLNGETPSPPAQHATNNNLPLVLLVEDNPDLREHIGQILNKRYRVLSAEDGVKGERLAIEHIPDIIISDVMMPKKDGYQLCNDLKSNTKTSHIPILMLTAKAGQDNKMEGLTLGADAYVIKPFNSEELLIRINNLINNRVKLWEYFNAMEFVVVEDLDVQSVDDQFLQQVMHIIRSNVDNEFLSVEDVAQEVGFSRSQLHRKLKALCNKSANQLIIEFRLNEAKRMLENKVGTVSEVAYSVGYSNMSYFTKSFKQKFGMLPSKV